MSFSPSQKGKILAVNALCGTHLSISAPKRDTTSEITTELRLTPTTLRRVITQRDKLEEEIVVLREENERLKEELLAHARCEATVKAFDEASKKSSLQLDHAQKDNELMRKKVEDLALALKVSEGLRESLKETADRAEKLEAQVKSEREESKEVRSRLAKAESEATEHSGPTAAEFFAALEMLKTERLMACISERVFVHVVAPKVILQINGGSGDKREYSPPCPRDDVVQAFIRTEIQPHFEMVFKTLDKTGGGDPPRSSVEGQRAPDGTTVRAYAERFNSTLANFIKKCVLES
jgi:hypothetical protein